MKLQTRLALIMLAIFFCGWLVAGIAAYAIENTNARKDTVHKAEVLLNTAVAARVYTAEEIRPLLADRTDNEFLPQTVPSYGAQQIFARLDEQYQTYTYAERALNPTNPKDLAEGWQVELIQTFIDNPDLKELIGERIDRSGINKLYVTQPIKITQEGCLDCHSTPDRAPVSLLKTYGEVNGFGWKLNEIIGIRLISIPVSVTRKLARDSILSFLLLIASIFLLAYTAVILLVRRWIIYPLNTIAHLVEEVSLGESEIVHLPTKRSDELGILSESINRLLISLTKSLSDRDAARKRNRLVKQK
ncbi:MAG: DUF3365 domain-containing protein [Cyanobacteria bacterium SBLK]|nr:DUF3365 domain-containing protein [Cyanobacteria bacterium SBLK]